MLEKTNDLFFRIDYLTRSMQSNYESSDFSEPYSSAHKILETFNSEEWEDLKNELPKWNQDQLTVLVETFGFYNNISNNYIIGYVFTLAMDNLASSMLSPDLLDFFEDNEITSIELLNSIKNRLDKLYTTDYLNDEELYNRWIGRIATAKNKAAH